jgi:hypothetical protein
MTPAKNLQTSFAAMMFTAFMLFPLHSNEAVYKTKKFSFNIQLSVADEGATKQENKMDLNKQHSSEKEKKNKGGNDHNKQNEHEQGKSKHHADEEKHKNHLYHYNRIKTRKKCHATFICVFLKIFIAVCYISVLLSGFMSLSH